MIAPLNAAQEPSALSAWLAANSEAGDLSAFGAVAPACPEADAAPRIPLEAYNPDDPNLWLYRPRTLGMLRRYMRLSIEVGRLPSLLGREFFRTRVTSYTSCTFEDLVIFVHDVERMLDRLCEFDRHLIATLVFGESTRREAGDSMGCTERTIQRRFFEVVDMISEMFLAGGLLDELEIEDGSGDEAEAPKTGPCDGRTSCGNSPCGKPCQEGWTEDFDVSGW